MPRSLQSLNALITGGASGLGAVIAHRLAAEGVNICLNGLPSDEAGAQEHCEVLTKEFRVKCTYVLADVSTPEGCASAVQYTTQTLGSTDIVISNAGWTRFAEWSDLDAFSEEEWIRSFKINTLSPLWLFKAASAEWKATYEKSGQAGVLITTNSLAGLAPTGSSLPYSVTKAGQLRMVEGLAYNNGPWVRVNAVCPGLIITPWSMRYGEEKINAMKEAAPLKKSVDLEDCADAFVMLSKNESITGKHITIDCGLAMVS